MFPAIMSVTYIRLYHTTDVKLSLWRSGAGDARINISPMQKRAAGADGLLQDYSESVVRVVARTIDSFILASDAAISFNLS